MKFAATGSMARGLSGLFEGGTLSGMREGQLLDRFRDTRDERAFATLVGRYGPMVRGVLRAMRVEEDAIDDAFQATFLVLARRAGGIRDPERLGAWLYGVAHRVAAKARVSTARRRAREVSTCPGDLALRAAPPLSESVDFADEAPLIHQEVARLPARYRDPVVLCWLDGQTHVEAAERMRCPVGTVKGRLSRARLLLRDRLARRGVTLGSASVLFTINRAARAEIPAFTCDVLAQAAAAFARGTTLPTALMPSAKLAERVLVAMTLSSLKWISTGVLAIGLISAGVGQGRALAPGSELASAAANGPIRQADARDDNAAEEAAAQDPDAPDANQRRLDAAKRLFDAANTSFLNGTLEIDRLFSASERLMDAEMRVAADAGGRRAAMERHLALAKQVAERERQRLHEEPRRAVDVAEADLALAEAEVRNGDEAANLDAAVTQVQHENTQDAAEPAQAAQGPVDTDALTQSVRGKLDFAISLPFQEGVTLADFVKYVQNATMSPELPLGIQVYIDPIALENAGLTKDATVSIALEGIPLKRGLFLALRSVGLAYGIQDGLLIISSREELQEMLSQEPIVEAQGPQ